MKPKNQEAEIHICIQEGRT